MRKLSETIRYEMYHEGSSFIGIVKYNNMKQKWSAVIYHDNEQQTLFLKYSLVPTRSAAYQILKTAFDK